MRVGVAYSGGRDSTALLHATLHAAGELGLEVVALHVHHGLSPHGDNWLEHCRLTCERWRNGTSSSSASAPSKAALLSFAHQRVQGSPPPMASVEAWARDERYAALAAMAQAHDLTLVLLAHHRRDQAETFLLQALRGAGVGGLAAMPRQATRRGITWARPWLGRTRGEIDAYLARHRLSFIEDESNRDERYARSRLRAGLWPELERRFEQAESALAMSATWAQEADSVLVELARLDLAAVAAEGPLDVARWLGLSEGRRKNVLRAWLAAQQQGRAGASLITRLASELPRAASGRWSFGRGELRAHRGALTWQPLSRAGTATSELPPPESESEALSIDGEGCYLLARWGGQLEVTPAASGGVSRVTLRALTVSRRRGGEQFQSGRGRPPRSLKKQFQSAGVASWERDAPLFYSGSQLVFVARLGIDARALAAPGEPQFALRWAWLAPRAPGAVRGEGGR